MRIALSVLVAFALTVTIHAEDADVLRIYDLTDLSEVQDFAPQPLGLVSVGGDASIKTTTAKVMLSENHTLDGILTKYFDPSMKAIIHEHSVLRGGSLFITGSPMLHAHVERVLSKVRDLSRVQVNIGAQLILMSPHIRQSRYALGGLGWKAVPEQPALAIAELTDVELDMVRESIIKDEDNAHLEFITFPLTMFAGQLNHRSMITQLAFKPVAFSSKANATDIAVINFGETLSIRATPTADHLFINLDIYYVHCALQEMKDIDLGPAGKAQVPVLWKCDEHIQRTIAVGHTLMVATSVYLVGNQPRAGFLLVHPELLEI